MTQPASLKRRDEGHPNRTGCPHAALFAAVHTTLISATVSEINGDLAAEKFDMTWTQWTPWSRSMAR